MMAWVTQEHNHQTGMRAPLDLRFDTAMRGSLGIGSSLNHLSPDELAVYQRKIAFYKKIRPVVQGGELYRLTTTMEPGDTRCSVWQSVAPDRSASVYSFVMVHQMLGHHVPSYPLKGLDSDAVYRATDEHGADLGSYSGSQLMALGLPGDQRFGGINHSIRSRTVLLERQ
jgi:alpha-galactosidase